MRQGENIGGAIVCISILSAIIWSMFIYTSWSEFNSGCEDYLKFACKAPTVVMADSLLGEAITYIEKKGLINGSAKILTLGKVRPASDVGIWYRQIKELRKQTSGSIKRYDLGIISLSELDNTFTKIQRALLDGDNVRTPDGHISWFPHQLAIFLWIAGTTVLCALGLLIFIKS